MPTLVQTPSEAVERIAEGETRRIGACVHRDRKWAQPRVRAPAIVSTPSSLAIRQTALVCVHVDDLRGAESRGDPGGVEAQAPGPSPADDQHRGLGLRGEMGRHGAPGVDDVVADRRGGGGVHPVGERDEHLLGVGHPHQVGEEAAPGTPVRREAVGGLPRDRLAVGGLSAATAPHTPQEIWNGTLTRMPGSRPSTPSATSTTSATHSWPSGNGPPKGVSPRTMGVSRSHVATASGRTNASPLPVSAGSGTSSQSSSPIVLVGELADRGHA